MAGENDLIKLYSGRILALAADIPNSKRLEAPAMTVKKRSPLCGSTVTVDVEFEGQTVSAFGQDVKACALGQAARLGDWWCNRWCVTGSGETGAKGAANTVERGWPIATRAV